MRILITGGAGFIGSNLAHAAAADASCSSLRLLDDLSTGDPANLDGLDAELITGSVLEDRTLDRAMAGMESVVHLAALPSVPRSLRDPVATHHANATGTLAVLQAARRNGVGHVVIASSSSVYGSNPTLPKREDHWTAPISPYAVSKLATESYALAFQASYGLPTLALRFFNVYGPRQRHDHAYAAVVPKFVHAALRGDPVTIFGDGRQTRDFTYVDTVCEVLLDAVRRSVRQSRPVNLAFGTRTDLLTIVSELSALLGRAVRHERAPERAGDVRHSQADAATLRDLFPSVTAVGLSEGIRATVEWFEREVFASARGGAR